MKPASVVPIREDVANDAPAPALPMPAHFAKVKRLRAAWADLIESTAPELHVRENRFTFEFAATLMAKLRSGRSMTATESKELKRQMVALGLAKDDDGGGKKKPSKAAGYFSGS